MAIVERLREVLDWMRRKSAERYKQAKRSHHRVGYTAAYAVFVHEAVGMKLKGRPRPSGRGAYWDPQPQAGPKFLEGPAREYAAEIGRMIRQDVARGMTLDQACLRASLFLLRKSQERVPVETGNLRRSGFVRKEGRGGDGGTVAAVVTG